nr:hypothetical protein GCM10020241_08160 [Streptoalloteichus tenebrarius]
MRESFHGANLSVLRASYTEEILRVTSTQDASDPTTPAPVNGRTAASPRTHADTAVGRNGGRGDSSPPHIGNGRPRNPGAHDQRGRPARPRHRPPRDGNLSLTREEGNNSQKVAPLFRGDTRNVTRR